MKTSTDESHDGWQRTTIGPLDNHDCIWKIIACNVRGVNDRKHKSNKMNESKIVISTVYATKRNSKDELQVAMVNGYVENFSIKLDLLPLIILLI